MLIAEDVKLAAFDRMLSIHLGPEAMRMCGLRIGGSSIQQIADEFGISRQSVNQTLIRAKHKLRQLGLASEEIEQKL